MKRIICSIITLCSLTVAMAGNPQKAEQKQIASEAKEYAKQGWKVTPGSLSMTDQIKRGWQIERELDEEGLNKWVVAEGKSIGTAYNSARMQSMTVAKNELAGKMSTEMTTLVEQKLGNDEVGMESVSQTIQASKGRFTQKLGRIYTLMECYRYLPDGRVEVLLRIAYPYEKAMKAMRDAVKENGGDSEIGNRLNEIMGW